MNLYKAILSVGTSRLVSAFIAFLTSVVIMNELSVTEYGDFYFYLSIITLATTLPSVGINNSYVFNCDTSLERKFISIKMLIALALSVCALILYILSLIPDQLIIVCLITGFCLSIFDSHLSNLQCKKKFFSYAITLPLKNIVILITALFYLSSFDNPVYIYSYLSVVILIILLFIYSKHINFKLNFSLFSKMAGNFYFFEISSLIMIRSETWWLKYYSDGGQIDGKQLGIYGVAFTVCAVVSIVSTAINSALLPYVKNKPSLLKIKNIIILFLLSSFFLVLFYFVTYLIVQYFFSEKYGEVIFYLGPILLGMLFSFLAGFVRLELVNRNLNTYLNKVYTFQLLLTIILGGGLIAFFGIFGAITVFAVVRFIGLILILLKYDYKNDKISL
ncbi:oligosaccharide flippase family protein [Pseudoalteromonas arctica]|jgi:O-antigen/teichoic acid export membrane protein|uniref:Oligosaccharide flippase family protein n=1 Tax=Pseudoalteromonas arctica TaxID=394751 RepID=A0A7X9U8J5_9GAMM|nr:oligosaccharide flippase family protein [Pseudoalteromonas arctica]NMF49601.1 oligosaccharide flippase family protein [Pseudoalteromonas arctica]